MTIAVMGIAVGLGLRLGAIARHGRPDVFNTDQGSRFTSFAFKTTLEDAGIRIFTDGRGRWMDNVFIERL